jgi:hypothetical protein
LSNPSTSGSCANGPTQAATITDKDVSYMFALKILISKSLRSRRKFNIAFFLCKSFGKRWLLDSVEKRSGGCRRSTGSSARRTRCDIIRNRHGLT